MRIDTFEGKEPCGKTYENIRDERRYKKLRELHKKSCKVCRGIRNNPNTNITIDNRETTEKVRITRNDMKLKSKIELRVDNEEEKTIN